MVILAHAVVPHHHHNKIFVSVVSLLGDDMLQEFNHHGKTHHHDKSDNSEECLINEVCAAAFRVNDDGYTVQHQTYPDLDFLSLFICDYPSEILCFQVFPFRQKPYLEFNHTVLITQSLGLRAPPFC